MRGRLRPSPTGVGVMIGAVALLAGGMWTGWAELLWLGTISLALTVLAVLMVLVLDRTVAARHEVIPSRVMTGHPASCRVRFRRSPIALSPVGILEQLDGVVSLVPEPAAASDETLMALPTNRRGVFEVGPLVSVRTDPFGLVRHQRQLDDPVDLIVHPRIWPVARDPASSLQDMDGPTVEEQVTGSDTFHRLREYEPGDEPRLIHWPASAHAGQLMIRHFVDTARPELTIVVDDLAESHHSAVEFDEVVEVVASLVAATSAAGAPVRVRSLGGRAAGAGPTESVAPIMDELAALELEPGLASATGDFGSDLAGAACVLVTGHGGHGSSTCRAVVDRLILVSGRFAVISVGSGPPPFLTPAARLVSGATAVEALERWSSLV